MHCTLLNIVTLFFDYRYCWYHYPYHYFDRGVWWYYMVELSFYWSLLLARVLRDGKYLEAEE